MIDVQGLNIAPDELRAQLPRPLLPARPGWERLYWRAWELGARMVRHGTAANGFASLYVDAAFGGNIFQWDTCLIAAFARYSDELLPVLPALDNFYGRQERDGYIAREYRWENGAPLWHKASADSINPPLFAWAEWLLFQVHGRHERLIAVWEPLTRYYRWLQLNRSLANGLYWSSAMGSGMDNTPRVGAAWCDLSLQQALNALSLACIAQTIGDAEQAQVFQAEHAQLARRINELMWDEQAGLYQDLDAGSIAVPSKTLAPFWALLAEVAPPERAARLVAHLHDPASFWRAHPFPTLAADQPLFRADGGYWLGGVWAPTNYVVISGLRQAGFHELALAATARHLDALLAVYEATGTIWENYRSDAMLPGEPARPDFVGWSGLGPIALLIEQVIGLELDADQHMLRWRLSERGPHGIENLPFAGDRLRLFSDGAGSVEVRCGQPLRLELSGNLSGTLAVPAGGMHFVVS
jgi:glycogen debranching enzyme